MIKQCLSCGGRDFIDGVELLDTGKASRRVATLCLEVDPSAMLFRDRRYSRVKVHVCADCGFVHSFAADLSKLLEGRELRDGVPYQAKDVEIQWEKG